MLVEAGEKLHIIERRYFETDLRRHFVGEVISSMDTMIRIVGYVWIYNPSKGEFVRKPEKRERIFNLTGDNRLTINIIPKNVDIDQVTYKNIPERGLVVTDGKDFELDVSEFTALR
jgi:hypothetical protein